MSSALRFNALLAITIYCNLCIYDRRGRKPRSPPRCCGWAAARLPPAGARRRGTLQILPTVAFLSRLCVEPEQPHRIVGEDAAAIDRFELQRIDQRRRLVD